MFLCSIIPDIKGYEIFSNDATPIVLLLHKQVITSSHWLLLTGKELTKPWNSLKSSKCHSHAEIILP